MIITTEHETKFQIDFDEKTWARIDKTGDSGNLRSESGTFNEADKPVIGQSFMMWCPPFKEGLGARLIKTSLVTKIEE